MNSLLICSIFLLCVGAAYSIKCYTCTANQIDCNSGDLSLLDKYKSDCELTANDYAAKNAGKRPTHCVKKIVTEGQGTVRQCADSTFSAQYLCNNSDFCNMAVGKFDRLSFSLLAFTACLLVFFAN